MNTSCAKCRKWLLVIVQLHSISGNLIIVVLLKTTPRFSKLILSNSGPPSPLTHTHPLFCGLSGISQARPCVLLCRHSGPCTSPVALTRQQKAAAARATQEHPTWHSIWPQEGGRSILLQLDRKGAWGGCQWLEHISVVAHVIWSWRGFDSGQLTFNAKTLLIIPSLSRRLYPITHENLIERKKRSQTSSN